MDEKKSLYNFSNKKLKIVKPIIESKNVVFDSGNIYVDPDYYLKNMDEEEAELYHETNDYIRNKYSIVAVNEEEEDKELYEHRFDEAYYDEANQEFGYGDEEDEERIYEKERQDIEKAEKYQSDLLEDERREDIEVDVGSVKNFKEELDNENLKKLEEERIQKELNFELSMADFEEDEDLVARFESFQNN
jgi:hypothetical protein